MPLRVILREPGAKRSATEGSLERQGSLKYLEGKRSLVAPLLRMTTGTRLRPDPQESAKSAFKILLLLCTG